MFASYTGARTDDYSKPASGIMAKYSLGVRQAHALLGAIALKINEAQDGSP